MRRLFKTICCIGAAVLGCAHAVAADCVAYLRFFGKLDGRAELNVRGNVQHYDDYGRYLGKAEYDNGSIKYYDDYGRYRGKAERDGSSVKFYDDYGRYQGKSEISR